MTIATLSDRTWPRQTPWLVLGLVMLLQGCAGLIQEEATPAAGTAREERVVVQKGRPGIVIGAPRGALDRSTDLIARDLARLTGFGLVVANSPGRLRSEADPALRTPIRFDAGMRGSRPAYETYRRHVAEAAQGPLALYVEVDGHEESGSAGHLEITTVGLGPDDSWRLRTLFELIRDSRVDDRAVPRLDVRVRPVDPARAGELALAPRALHIDVPGAARTTYREVYTAVLGAFLSESVAVLVPRAR